MKASVTHLTAQRMLFGCCCGNNVGQFATVAVTELSREGGYGHFGSLIALVAGGAE